jgi:hypothetical protein
LQPVYLQPAPDIRVPSMEMRNEWSEFAKPFAEAARKREEREAQEKALEEQFARNRAAKIEDRVYDEALDARKRDWEMEDYRKKREMDFEFAAKRGRSSRSRRAAAEDALGGLGDGSGLPPKVPSMTPPAAAGQLAGPSENTGGYKFMTWDKDTRTPNYELTDEDVDLARNQALAEGAKNKIGNPNLLNAIVEKNKDEIRRQRINEYEKYNPPVKDTPQKADTPKFVSSDAEYVYDMASKILGDSDPRAQQLASQYRRSLKQDADGNEITGMSPEEYIQKELPKLLTDDELNQMNEAMKAGGALVSPR